MYTNLTLVHGDMDYITDIEQSRVMAQKGHKLHIMHGKGHTLTEAEIYELFEFLIK